ncbi:MAG: hypothetical protein WC700_17045 [Gemmatimonadaceae bacterium]|jgi:hypothetical protein
MPRHYSPPRMVRLFKDPTAVTAREFVEVLNANDPRAEAVLHDDGSVIIKGVGMMRGYPGQITIDTTPPPERQCCGCRHWAVRTATMLGDANCRRKRKYVNAYDAACGWYKP